MRSSGTTTKPLPAKLFPAARAGGSRYYQCFLRLSQFRMPARRILSGLSGRRQFLNFADKDILKAVRIEQVQMQILGLL